MECKYENANRTGRGCTTGSNGLPGLIREIRAIRGSLPELDHGSHGFHGFFGRTATVGQSRSGSVASSRAQSNQSDHATEANEANEVELPRAEPAPRRITFVSFVTFCSNPFQIPSRPQGDARISRNFAPTSAGRSNQSHSVAPSQTQSKVSSRFKVQSSKSRKPVALGQTQSNRSHPTEANEANEVELPRSEPAPRQIPFVNFVTFCSNPFRSATRCADFTHFRRHQPPPGKPVAPSRTQSHPVKLVKGEFKVQSSKSGKPFAASQTQSNQFGRGQGCRTLCRQVQKRQVLPIAFVRPAAQLSPRILAEVANL